MIAIGALEILPTGWSHPLHLGNSPEMRGAIFLLGLRQECCDEAGSFGDGSVGSYARGGAVVRPSRRIGVDDIERWLQSDPTYAPGSPAQLSWIVTSITRKQEDFTMDTSAPIRQVTLYKHGVAHIVREANFEGTELPIAVKPSDLDDALKSCTVAASSAGSVVKGIDYRTPGSQSRESSVTSAIGSQSAMVELLNELVGWPVNVTLRSGTTHANGRVVGVQLSGPADRQSMLLSDPETGAVQCLLLSDIAQVAPRSPLVQARWSRELNARQQPQGVQEFTVRVNPGHHRLVVSYLVPSASWRISYRASASNDAQGSPVVRLQAWGLVDNQFGEDLRDVNVAMVAGQPISFRYELAQPVTPERVTVADKSRKAAGPVGFDAGSRRSRLNEVAMDVPSQAMQYETLQDCFDLPAAGTIDAEVQDLVELFEYRVKEPVTMPVGTSALVPLFTVELPGQRELLFNDRKYSQHPVRALLCTNASGYVLENGPLTVTEEGVYRGEAVLPFTATGADLYLPYAVELGISVGVQSRESTEVVSMSASNGKLWQEECRVTEVAWTLSNRTDRDELVTLECDRNRLQGELQPTSSDVTRLENVYRWKVRCAPHSITEFAVLAREVTRREIRGVPTAEILRKVAAGSLCSAELADCMKPLLPLLDALSGLKADVSRLQSEIADIEEELSETRENVSMLSGADAEEVDERRTAVRRALQLSNQLSALKAQRTERKQSVADTQAEIDNLLLRAVDVRG